MLFCQVVAVAALTVLLTCSLQSVASPLLTIVSSNCVVVNASVTELLCSSDTSAHPVLFADVVASEPEVAIEHVTIWPSTLVTCETVQKRGLPRYTIRCALPSSGEYQLIATLPDGRHEQWPLFVSAPAGPSELDSSLLPREAHLLASERLVPTACPNGQPDENGECQCEVFHGGPDCSIPCPGLHTTDCSDADCYGYDSSKCGDTCSWSSILNMCTGINSCVENVCSGKGTCNWGPAGDATCKCSTGYFGENCDRQCTVAACRDEYAIQVVECNSQGTCTCSGHYGTLPSLCTDCKDGWYGTDCEKACPCSGNGACDQLSGECSCFADDDLGYWTGKSCADCQHGYTGKDCLERNLILGPGASTNITFPDYTSSNISPGAGEWLSTGSTLFRLAYGSTVALCPVTLPSTSCEQAAVDGTLWDVQRISGVVIYVTVEITSDAVVVRVVNESRGTTFHLMEVSAVTLPPLEDAQDVIAAVLSSSFGWIVVLSDGSVASQSSGTFTAPPPAAGSFTAQSMTVTEMNSIVYVVGSANGVWMMYTYSLSDHTFTSSLSAQDVASLENYTSAAAVAVDSTDGSLAVVLTNATALAFVRFTSASSSSSASTTWSATAELTDAKSEDFLYTTLKVGSDRVLYFAAHTSAGVRVHTTQWSDNRVLSTQLITDGVSSDGIWQPFVSLNSDLGVFVLTSQNKATTDMQVRLYSSFAVNAVTPLIIDRSGGTTLTVMGHSFIRGSQCLFSDGSTSSAIFVNTTSVRCVVPFLQSPHIFASYEVEVLSYVTWLCTACITRSANEVAVTGFATPAPTRAYGANNVSYVSMYATASIMVDCLGAPNLDSLLCRFEDDAGMSLLSSASFVTSELVICDMPKVPRPSSGTSGTVTISIDGSVFSPGTPFTFVGEASALQVVSVSSVAVAARDRIEFPTVLLHVVDNESHSLFELDDTRVVTATALWFNSTRKELDTFISAYQSVVLSTYSNQTKVGETSFGVSLQYPRVGVGMLAFTSPGLGQALLSFSVSEGEPASMILAVEPETQVDNLHATKARQPVVIFRDIADNTVYNLTISTAPVTEVTAFFNNGTLQVSTNAALNTNGYFEFSDVFTSGLFGKTYDLIFSSPGFANVTSSKAIIVDCYPDQYAVYGTTYCLPCPSDAICNGSYSFNVTDGVWKGGELAYTVLTCPLQEACVGGQCVTGYSGPLCATCSNGYGKEGVLCKRCYSTAANIVITVFLVITYIAFLLGVVILLHQLAGPHFRSVQLLIVMINFVQVIAVVVYPLSQLPLYMNDFSTFLRILGFCNLLRLPTLACLGLNAHIAFIVMMVAPLAAVPIFRAVLWEADKLNNRHFRKLEEERRILRGFIPYASPEAYYSRITFLGLDDEPAFRNESASSTEKLEVQKNRIRQAYALLDKNSSAFATISQMGHSKARETALQTLVDEREELIALLTRYEGLVSRANNGGGSGGRGLKRTSSLSQLQHQLPTAGGDGGGAGGQAGKASAGLNDTVTDLEGTRASCLSGVSQLTSEQSDQQDMFNTSGTDADGTRGDEALLARFPELTATQLTLFGERESFNPIRQNINFSKEFESEEERNVARVMRRVSSRVTFVWPSLPHKTLFLLLTFMYYLYPVVVGGCFALVRCAKINYGITSRDNTREEEESVLRADYTISCSSTTHHAYRIAAITLGSVVGGGLVLFLFFTYLTRRRHDRLARFFAFALSLRLERAWWAGVMALEKFALVIMSTLVGGDLGVLVSFWVLVVMLLLFMQIRPMTSSFLFRTEVCARTAAIIVTSLQLLPFLNSSAGVEDATTGSICAAFMVIVACCSIVGIAALAVAEFVSPGALYRSFVLCLRRLEYTKLLAEDHSDDDDINNTNTNSNNNNNNEIGDASVYSPESHALGVARAPFSFEVYNAALVSDHLRQSEVASQEKHNLLDHHMNALLRQRSSSLSGRSRTMTSVWLAGVAAVGTVSNVELLADFIDNSEAYVERPRALQRDVQRYRTDSFASIHNVESEMGWEHLVLLEHAQQLDSVVSRLTQIAHSGHNTGASMRRKVH